MTLPADPRYTNKADRYDRTTHGFSESHFAFKPKRRLPPEQLILPSKTTSAPSQKIKGRNAYWIAGLALGAVLAFGGGALLLPHSAGAFWPLSVTNADGTPSPLLPDSSLTLLSAPTSSYADAYFDGYTPDTVDGSALNPELSGDGLGTSTPITNISTTTPANTPSVPNNGEISTYTVQEGDNLSSIAAKYGISVSTILWANNIKDPSTIKAGRKLVMLPVSGIQHTVVAGETLSSIATKFGGDASDIAQFNGLSDGAPLQAGSTIIIPGGELTSSSKSSTSSSGTSIKTTTTTTKTSSGSIAVTTPTTSHSGSPSCDDTSDNPCHGINGASLHGFFVNPLPGARLTQGLHGWNAVDLSAPSGTPIRAAAGGTVILSRTGGYNGGYGNYVILDNGSGVETLYAHMSETKAEEGDTVSAGEVIGYVGMTGDATGPHLHFEVRGAQNPFAFCSLMTVCANPD